MKLWIPLSLCVIHGCVYVKHSLPLHVQNAYLTLFPLLNKNIEKKEDIKQWSGTVRL